jgi:hypothetical protein
MDPLIEFVYDLHQQRVMEVGLVSQFFSLLPQEKRKDLEILEEFKTMKIFAVRGCPTCFEESMTWLLQSAFGDKAAPLLNKTIGVISLLIVHQATGRRGRTPSTEVCSMISFQNIQDVIYISYIAVSNAVNSTPKPRIRNKPGRGYECLGLGSLMLKLTEEIGKSTGTPTLICCHVSERALADEGIAQFYTRNHLNVVTIPPGQESNLLVQLKNQHHGLAPALTLMKQLPATSPPHGEGEDEDLAEEAGGTSEATGQNQSQGEEEDGEETENDGEEEGQDTETGDDSASAHFRQQLKRHHRNIKTFPMFRLDQLTNIHPDTPVIEMLPDLDSFLFATQDVNDLSYLCTQNCKVEFTIPCTSIRNRGGRLVIMPNRRSGFNPSLASGKRTAGGIHFKYLKNIRLATITTANHIPLFLNMYILENDIIATSSQCDTPVAAALVACHNYVQSNYHLMWRYIQHRDTSINNSHLDFGDHLGTKFRMVTKNKETQDIKQRPFQLMESTAFLYLNLIMDALTMIANGEMNDDAVDHGWTSSNTHEEEKLDLIRNASKTMDNAKYFVADVAGCKLQWTCSREDRVVFTASQLKNRDFLNAKLNEQVQATHRKIHNLMLKGEISSAQSHMSTFMAYDIGHRFFSLRKHYHPLLSGLAAETTIKKGVVLKKERVVSYLSSLQGSTTPQAPNDSSVANLDMDERHRARKRRRIPSRSSRLHALDDSSVATQDAVDALTNLDMVEDDPEGTEQEVDVQEEGEDSDGDEEGTEQEEVDGEDEDQEYVPGEEEDSEGDEEELDAQELQGFRRTIEEDEIDKEDVEDEEDNDSVTDDPSSTQENSDGRRRCIYRYPKFGTTGPHCANAHSNTSIRINVQSSDGRFLFVPREETTCTRIAQFYMPHLKSGLQYATYRKRTNQAEAFSAVMDELLSSLSATVANQKEVLADATAMYTTHKDLLRLWRHSLSKDDHPFTCRYEVNYLHHFCDPTDLPPPVSSEICPLDGIRLARKKTLCKRMEYIIDHCLSHLDSLFSLPQATLGSLHTTIAPETKTALVGIAECASMILGIKIGRKGGVISNCFKADPAFYDGHLWTIPPSQMIPISEEDSTLIILWYGAKAELWGSTSSQQVGPARLQSCSNREGSNEEDGMAWIHDFVPSPTLKRIPAVQCRAEYYNTAKQLYCDFLEVAGQEGWSNPWAASIDFNLFPTLSLEKIQWLLQRVAERVHSLYRIEMAYLVTRWLARKYTAGRRPNAPNWARFMSNLSKCCGKKSLQELLLELPWWPLFEPGDDSEADLIRHPVFKEPSTPDRPTTVQWLLSKVAGTETFQFGHLGITETAQGWKSSPTLALLRCFARIVGSVPSVSDSVTNHYQGNPFETFATLAAALSKTFLNAVETRRGPCFVWQTYPSNQTGKGFYIKYYSPPNPAGGTGHLMQQVQQKLKRAVVLKPDKLNHFLFYCPNKASDHVKKWDAMVKCNMLSKKIAPEKMAPFDLEPCQQAELVILMRAKLVCLLRQRVGHPSPDSRYVAVTAGMIKVLYRSGAAIATAMSAMSKRCQLPCWTSIDNAEAILANLPNPKERELLTNSFKLATTFIRSDYLALIRDHSVLPAMEENTIEELVNASIFSVMDTNNPSYCFLGSLQTAYSQSRKLEDFPIAIYFLARFGVFTPEAAHLTFGAKAIALTAVIQTNDTKTKYTRKDFQGWLASVSNRRLYDQTASFRYSTTEEELW